MDFGLKGRVAIVAAASKGLGRAVATEFAKEGCEVAICARTPADLERAANEIGKASGRAIFWRALDVSKPEAVSAFVDEVDKNMDASISASRTRVALRQKSFSRLAWKIGVPPSS